MDSETRWVEGNTPLSARFDDTYFSRIDGRAETAHVFIAGNGLPERWQDVDRFAIAELGFGTGLNFLETWSQWTSSRNPAGHLTFTSFEAFPLDVVDARKALARWTDLAGLAATLLDKWERLFAGGQTIGIDEQTSLEIVCGDARATLPGWKGQADAWFLDGFSPDRNPELWSAELMQEVYRHTAPGGTFATYTAAGEVRRNLAAAGFSVERVSGPPGKRHMTVGRRTA